MGVIEGLRAPKMFTERLRPPEPRSECCLNCGAPMTGPFCAKRGQRAIPPYPTIGELTTDAFWELSGWDGRFAATVRILVRSPGRLNLYFGLHLHAFVFVALTLVEAARFTHSAAVTTWIGTLVAVWIVAYAATAVRRVYGGSWTATIGKGSVVVSLYALAGLLGLVAAIYWAALWA
jgi:hypothetical protein